MSGDHERSRVPRQADLTASFRERLAAAGVTDLDELVAQAVTHVRETGESSARATPGEHEDLYIFASSWFFFITPY